MEILIIGALIDVISAVVAANHLDDCGAEVSSRLLASSLPNSRTTVSAPASSRYSTRPQPRGPPPGRGHPWQGCSRAGLRFTGNKPEYHVSNAWARIRRLCALMNAHRAMLHKIPIW